MTAPIERALRHCHAHAGSPIISARSDLTHDGYFGEEWVVVTEDRLLVLQVNNGSSAIRHDLSLKDIQAARLISLVGCGVLTVTVFGKPVELIRYSQGKHRDFSAVVQHLTDPSHNLTTGRADQKPQSKPLAQEENRCPQCKAVFAFGEKSCRACSTRSAVLSRLARYLKPFRLQTALMAVLILSSTAVGLVTPYLTRPLVDQVLVPVKSGLAMNERVFYLLIIGGAMLGCQLLALGINISQGRIASRFTHQLANTLRADVFRHLQFLPIRYFDQREVGSLVSRITQDTLELEGALTVSAQFLLANVLTILGIGIVLAVLNWKLFLLVILPLPLAFLLSRLTYGKMFTLWNRWWYTRGRLYALLTENLIGIRVVKAFAQEPAEIKRFNQRSADLAAAGQTAEKTWLTLSPILTLITGLGALIVWVVGGKQVLAGRTTFGTLMTFIAYLTMFYVPFQFVNRITEWLGRTLTAAERVFDILDSPPDTPPANTGTPLPRIQGAVSFRHVWFGYNVHVPVLKEINLAVSPGEMIGLVGHSGAGKSTLINLLCRFYDVNEGRLLIDGTDIREIPQPCLRSQIGIVAQDTFLFNTSIAQNIAYAKPDATMLDVIAAAEAANAHQFIMRKPDGYDTIVGERGQSLSVGERQRLAIARAILHNPRILVLDEATSAVDVETERQIQEALDHLIEGRTTFAIAHRLSTLRHADRLIVLKQGEIAEIGTHDELLKRDGEFSRLVHLQQETSKVNVVER